MCIYFPQRGARRLVGQVLSIGITFSRRASRAPACSEVISPRTPQNATARARCLLCCPDAHLAFTRFPPSLGHRDRINELLDLEIGWVRTTWARGHPIPMQNQGTQNQELVSSPPMPTRLPAGRWCPWSLPLPTPGTDAPPNPPNPLRIWAIGVTKRTMRPSCAITPGGAFQLTNRAITPMCMLIEQFSSGGQAAVTFV